MVDLHSDSEKYPGAPGWVKVLGIVVLVVILLLVVVFAFIGGDHGGGHGPGRHEPVQDAAGLAVPESAFQTGGSGSSPEKPAGEQIQPSGGHAW